MDAIHNYLVLNDKLSSSGMPAVEQLASLAEAGVQVVINLAPHEVPNAIPNEPERMAALGMDYIHIPVNWNTPTKGGLDVFMDALDANRHKRVHVHCEANFRATAFITMYRILRLGWEPEAAFRVMHTIWDEDAYPVWKMFIEGILEGRQENWIGGDGGPLVVLQSGALAHWRGAADFQQSRMNGGSLETDYDIICECQDNHVHRHGRDMLVLDDCEWSGRIFRLADGVVMIEQPYYRSDKFPDVVRQIAAAQPQASFAITVEDDRLRLLVGADDSAGSDYGFAEVEIETGPKRCDVYRFDNVLAITLSPG